MNAKKEWLTTGAFAKLCGVSKHTLFHYDAMGLFSPQRVDEKGYRYYHVLQYDTFRTIAQLQTTEMTLQEVKAYLACRSPEKLHTTLLEREAVLEKKINALKAVQAAVRSTRLQMAEAVTIGGDIVCREEAEMPLCLTDPLMTRDDAEMTEAFSELAKAFDNGAFQQPSGMVTPVSAVRHGVATAPVRFFIVPAPATEVKTNSYKPSGTYLTAYHIGDYSDLEVTRRRLIDYADAHGYTLDAYFYEERIVGDWAVTEAAQYVLKVSVKIGG